MIDLTFSYYTWQSRRVSYILIQFQGVLLRIVASTVANVNPDWPKFLQMPHIKNYVLYLQALVRPRESLLSKLTGIVHVSQMPAFDRHVIKLPLNLPEIDPSRQQKIKTTSIKCGVLTRRCTLLVKELPGTGFLCNPLNG